MVSIRTLILPLQDKKVIIPSAGISEVIKMTVKPFKKTNFFPWFMGNIAWRETKIPVVSLETFSNTNIPPKISNKPYMAILSSPFKSDQYPFIGINLQNIPKLKKFKETDLSDLQPHHERLFDTYTTYQKDQLFLINIDEIASIVETLSQKFGT